jgi:hypothetical protein
MTRDGMIRRCDAIPVILAVAVGPVISLAIRKNLNSHPHDTPTPHQFYPWHTNLNSYSCDISTPPFAGPKVNNGDAVSQPQLARQAYSPSSSWFI